MAIGDGDKGFLIGVGVCAAIALAWLYVGYAIGLIRWQF